MVTKLYAKEDTLASVLVLDRSMETCPEPYRGHNDTEIVVSFDVYKEFINKYLSVTDYLATDTVKLLSYLKTCREEELCRCFYKDVAIAVAKEIWYTDIGGAPTKITHVIDGACYNTEEYVSVISKAFAPQLSRASRSLLEYLDYNEYPMSPTKLVKFDAEFSYATLLFAMSSFDNEFGVPFCKWSLERK